MLEIGDGYRAKNSELGREGVPFARAANINGGFHFDSADRFPSSQLSKIGNKVSSVGDVVFTSKGTVGRFAYVRASTPPFVYSPQLCFWRSLDHDRLLPRFLYYWMQSSEFLGQIDYLKGQTDMADYVSLRDQKRMHFTLPLPHIQRGIVSVLDPIDERIDTLRQQNATLEAVAQAIFKSWFVDFDPVKAKVEGRDPEGMDADTAALFPSEFQDSELGLIPKGWTVENLSDAIMINPTRSLKKGSDAPYLDMANTPVAGHRPSGWLIRAFGSGTKFTNGDTLLARITPCLENGKTALVDFLQPEQIGWGSTEFIVLGTRGSIPPEFIYLLARWEPFRSFAIQSMSGTSGRQRVQTDRLGQYKLALPGKQVLEQFGAVIAPIFARIKSASEQSKTLAQVRDSLLPKLISGQLRIPEAANCLTEVLA
ncbi:MAG TPA: restriction endonuclease subunit S [Clostridia bacterium]|nr:restriction endonuclease subunit S [Clostridia bacterium]